MFSKIPNFWLFQYFLLKISQKIRFMLEILHVPSEIFKKNV